MSVKSKRRKEQQKTKAAKKAAMYQPGGESKYAHRKAARNNGAPMTSRAREGRPWWEPVLRWWDAGERWKAGSGYA